MIAAFSCANGGFYASTRSLYGLARIKMAPKFLRKLNSAAIPCLLLTAFNEDLRGAFYFGVPAMIIPCLIFAYFSQKKKGVKTIPIQPKELIFS